MKKSTIWLITMMLISTLGFTGPIKPEKVPATVRQAFAGKFPSVSDARYKKFKQEYKIVFTEKGKNRIASFDESGTWLETETILVVTDLPPEVFETVNSNFEGYSILNPVNVEMPELAPFFKMELMKGGEGYTVSISPDGKVLNRTGITEEDDDYEVN